MTTPPIDLAELERAEAADEVFLIHSCGDGEYRSDLVFGREAARRKVAEHMYFGTFEEAMEDPVAGGAVKDFDDPDEWGMDRSEWRYHGEQFWIGAMRITEKSPLAALCSALRRAVEGLKESDCTCGSEGPDSDHSHIDGGCIRCEALTEIRRGVSGV